MRRSDAFRVVCLVGTPNVGKSSLFSKLTGEYVDIGNWTGVTVEAKQGIIHCGSNKNTVLVDLPGTYSLKTPISKEERITREFLEKHKNKDIVVVIDATAIKRGLKILKEIVDLKIKYNKLYVVLTKMDLTKKAGISIDLEGLENALGIDFFILNPRTGENVDEFKKILCEKKDDEKTTLKNFEIQELTNRFVKIIDRKPGFEDKMDVYLTHPVLGPIISLLFFFLIFKIVFFVATPIQRILDLYFFKIGSYLSYLAPEYSSFIKDALIFGVCSVLSFFPVIFVLFILLSFLEDCGFMARVSVSMEKIMRKFDLPGKSIIPLILCFGCNVPGVLATRCIECKKERKITMMINPLIPCSARLVVISFFVNTFFSSHKAIIASLLYGLSLALALLSAVLFSKLLKEKEESCFVMELPHFNLPSPKIIITHAWERSKEFLKKAATVILFGSILMWYLSTHPYEVGTGKSYIERIGMAIAPLFRTIGLGWKDAVCLIFGILAKENIIASYSILYGISSKNTSALMEVLRKTMAWKNALIFVTFAMIYIPCLATIVAIKEESDLKTAVLVTLYTISLAFLVSFVLHIFLFTL